MSKEKNQKLILIAFSSQCFMTLVHSVLKFVVDDFFFISNQIENLIDLLSQKKRKEEKNLYIFVQ